MNLYMLACNVAIQSYIQFFKEARTRRFSKAATAVLSAGSSFTRHKVRNSQGFKK